jgi:hypothetical protein
MFAWPLFAARDTAASRRQTRLLVATVEVSAAADAAIQREITARFSGISAVFVASTRHTFPGHHIAVQRRCVTVIVVGAGHRAAGVLLGTRVRLLEPQLPVASSTQTQHHQQAKRAQGDSATMAIACSRAKPAG